MACVEICINTDSGYLMENVLSAATAGAKRLELCANMAEAGLTPNMNSLQKIFDSLTNHDRRDEIACLVMIRPRAGDFVYSESEILLMQRQIDQVAKLGADGVVFGALNQHKQIDINFSKRLVTTAKAAGLSCTFHRAFDVCPNQRLALEQLIALGVDRVLTAGTAWLSGLGAKYGVKTLQQLAQLSQDRIEIVIGGGLGVDNALDILRPLKLLPCELSLHAYSGVMRDQKVQATWVEQLVGY